MAAPARRPVLARYLTLAAALAMTLAGAGCAGSAEPDKPAPAATGVGGIGAKPTTSAPPASPTAAPLTPKPPAYPTTAKAYAQAVLSAWKLKQLTRLGNLTTPMVQEQIMEIPGPPNQSWTFQRCVDSGGSTRCEFINADGDLISLTISNALVSKAHATTAVALDLTVYATDPVKYVTAFLEAWQDANRARMLKLSNPAAVEYYTHYAPPESWSTCTDGAAGTTYVRVYNADGLNYTVKVTNTALGGPNAISGNSEVAAACS